MKALLFLVGILFFLVACGKKQENSQVYPSTIIDSISRICTDTTVLASLKNDSLKIHVNVAYTCGAGILTDCQIKEDSLFISLKDTCTSSENYCRCICYFISDFIFLDVGKKEYPYQITLTAPYFNYTSLYRKGTVKVK